VTHLLKSGVGCFSFVGRTSFYWEKLYLLFHSRVYHDFNHYIAHRIWIKKMTFHYVRLITNNLMITIDKTLQRRSRGRKQRRKSYTSKKASARKGGREMVIEMVHYVSPLSGRFIKSQRKRGQTPIVDYTCRSFITRRFQTCLVG
jgi:hypothetical protein